MRGTFLISPFYFVSPVIVRTYFDAAYTLATTTTNATGYTSSKTFTTTEVSGKNYAIFAMSFLGTPETGTNDARGRLVEGATQRILNNMEGADLTDVMSAGGMYAYAGGTNRTFTYGFSSEVNGDDMTYRGYSLCGLELDGNDYMANSAGSTTSAATGTNWASKTSVTVSSGTPKDYIIVASAAVSANIATGTPQIRINVANASVNTQHGFIDDIFLQDITNFSPYWYVMRANNLTNQTITLEFRAGAIDTLTTIREASIIALDVSRFTKVYFANSEGNVSTTSTTASNAFVTTFEVANPANKHLLLAGAHLSSNIITASAICKLRNITGALDYTPEHFRESNEIGEEYPTVVARVITLGSNTTNVIAWQFRSETTSVATNLESMSIALLDLGTTV